MFCDKGIPPGYIFLLEAIMVVVFRSLNDDTTRERGRKHRESDISREYNNPEVGDFIRDVQMKVVFHILNGQLN